VLKKYLKGRQKLGSPDNLPMVFGQDREHERAFQSPHSDEMHLVYRVLLDMKQEMGDMKKMLGTLFYQNVHGGNVPKSLPAASSSVLRSGRNPREESSIRDISEISVGDAPYSDVDVHDEDGSGGEYPDDTGPRDSDPDRSTGHGSGAAPNTAAGPSGQPLTEDQKKLLRLFEENTLPSVEEMEKFLIEQALEKYGGNRRKAARILGMSERTLYRKIDQYGLI